MAGRVYLDANVFIYMFEGPEVQAGAIRRSLKFPERRPGIAVTSELTLAEILVRRDPVLRRLIFNTLIWRKIIDLVPVGGGISIQSADLRKQINLKLPDAVHISTAIDAQCSFMMSSDKDMRKIPGSMSWVRPDVAGISAVELALA